MSLSPPTLSDVTSWNPKDLTAHSAHWQDLAERRTTVLNRIKSDASDLDFTGAGHKGMMDAVWQHHATAIAGADELMSASQTAERYAEQLSQQRRTILGIVAQAKEQKFAVSPMWQVTDMQSRTATEAMVRQQAGQAIAAQLGQHVATFMATHTAAGVDLSTHAGKLAGVQMVDNRVFKQDPLISNPADPDKPNPIVGPAPKTNPPKTDDKSLAGQAFDGMTDVVGGTMTDIGGVAALIAGGAAEPATGGMSTVAVVGGVGALYEGTKKVEDGLDQLLHLGNG